MGRQQSSRGVGPSRRAYRQVFDVLVLGVDDVSQVLAVHLLLEDPHVHIVLELVRPQHIAADNLGDRRAPVTRADDGNLLLLRGGCEMSVGQQGERVALEEPSGGVSSTWAPPRMRRASRRVPATAASTEQSRVTRSILLGFRPAWVGQPRQRAACAASRAGAAAGWRVGGDLRF